MNGGGQAMEEFWFSARCLFVLEAPEGDIRPRRVYEERIVLFRAASFEDAMRQAEAEAREYAADTDGCRYLDHVDVCLLTDDELASGSEVYTLFRDGDPEPDDFVARFTADYWEGLDVSQSDDGAPAGDVSA